MIRDAKILIVDDDKTIRETIAFALEQEGYAVDRAENGEEAISKTFEKTYHLAIVDFRLPDYEGTKLLGKFRKTTPKMAKIMLTGFPSMSNAIAAVNEHADAFLVKPIDLDILIKKVEELIRNREKEQTFTEINMVSFLETRAKEILDKKSNSQINK